MIGKKISFFDQIDSTNNYMKKHNHEFHDGDVLVAKTQTSGRGRRDHIWVSPRGNLYATFYHNDVMFQSPFDVVMLYSIALIEVLRNYNITATIKYPNDILIGNKKIAGILIEHIQDAYIVGIGLNVLQLPTPSSTFVATSIEDETSTTPDFRDVLQDLIRVLNERITSPKLWYDDYIKHSFVIGKYTAFNGDKWLIKDIDESGNLLLSQQGKEQKITMNEVTLEDILDD